MWFTPTGYTDMTHQLLRKTLANAITRIPYESTSPDVVGICKAWRDDIEAMAADVGLPPVGYSLIHLDKTKWYGPGNVKWLPLHMLPRFRRDNPALRDYYARTQVVLGTPIPKRRGVV
jgi:hypothetical protein